MGGDAKPLRGGGGVQHVDVIQHQILKHAQRVAHVGAVLNAEMLGPVGLNGSEAGGQGLSHKRLVSECIIVRARGAVQ